MTTVAARLAAARGEARRDVEVLLGHLLGRSRAWLYAHGECVLTDAQTEGLDALVARRELGEPVAYLTGRREFWGLELEVGPETLVPRPDTEILVEQCLAHIPVRGSVLDVGTGAGAVVLAVARERPDACLTATDIDPDALAVARRNAERLGAAVEFLVADLYDGLAGLRFDVIVSNPPYVAEHDPHLATLRFEPRRALVAGPDGLAVLRRLIAGAPDVLEPGGWLVVEHGAEQGASVRTLFAASGFSSIRSERDLAGHERVTLGTQ